MNEFVKQQDAVKSGAVDHLGHVVWWTVEGEVERKLFDSICLGASVKPLRKRPEASFTQAMAEVKTAQPGVIARRIKNDLTQTTCVLASTTTDASRRALALGDQEWVLFDKMSGEIHWKEKTERTEKFRERFEHFESVYQPSDVRSVIEREISDNTCISLRASGGIYFVPAGSPVIGKIDSLLVPLNNSSSLVRIALAKGDEKGKETIRADFENNRVSLLDGMLEAIKDGIDTKGSVKLSKNLRAMLVEAEAIEMVVGSQLTGLRKGIERVHQKLAES